MNLFDPTPYTTHPAEWLWPTTDGVLTDDEAAELLGWTTPSTDPMATPLAAPLGSWETGGASW